MSEMNETVVLDADSELIEKVKDFELDAEDGLQGFFERMEKCVRFKVGKQWDEDVKAYNTAHRKHSLTINRVLPIVNDICGTEIQNKRDIKVRNLKGGTATAANILTAITKHALDLENTEFKKSQMFEDGLDGGAGYIGAFIDKDKDFKGGDLRIERLEAGSVLPDPNNKSYDLNKGKFVIYRHWEKKDYIESKYPKKKDDLANLSYHLTTDQSLMGRLMSFLFDKPGQNKTEYGDSNGLDDSSVLSHDKYEYLVTDTWYKEFKPCVLLFDSESPFDVRTITKPKDMKAVKNAVKKLDGIDGAPERFKYKESVAEVLHLVKRVGDVLLKHIEDPQKGVSLFPIVRFSPYFKDGYMFGIVENLIDSQEEENWSHSQALNLLKKVANAGWLTKKLMGNYGRFLEEHGSEDGVVLEESQAGGKIEKIKPTTISAGHFLLSEKAAQNMQEIANVRLEKPEFDTKNMSGKAIMLKQSASLKGSSTIFSNYDYTLELFGNLVVELIRANEVYTMDEIKAVVDEADLIDPGLLEQAAQILAKFGIEKPQPPADVVQLLMQANTDPTALGATALMIQKHLETYQVAQRQYEQTLRLQAQELLYMQLKSVKVGKYGIKVSQSPQSETMRIANFMEMLEIEKIRPNQIPLKTLLEASDIKNKEAVIEDIQNMPPMPAPVKGSK